MSWSTAQVELRTELSDNPNDKLSWKKKVFGAVNGSNRTFKTYELRRVTDLTSASFPMGVYVSGNTALVQTDFLEVGEFVLSSSGSAPQINDEVVASYYSQWFTDDQIETLLQKASKAILSTPTYIDTPEGLQAAILKYASADAYQELAVRYARLLSAQYRAEDLPIEDLKKTQEAFEQLEKNYRKNAMDLVKFYYTRQGQSDQPLFGNICGHVHNVEPNR